MTSDDDKVVGGRYRLGRLLGRGGMAEVHEGYDQRLGRQVAIKQLSAHLAADSDAHVRFDREAHAAASLNHPTIASVFDTGEDTDPNTGVSIPYIVMELVDGETLSALLRRSGAMPPEQAVSLTSRVLDALQHSHAGGIIHRDIKPGNVMVTSTGAVKVMDFGIARAIDETSHGLTQSAVVIGTAQYLSPEQASGRTVDPRSDLYSVGCLLYELLTGRPPFVGDSQIAVAYQHVRELAAPPSSVNPALNPALDAIVMRALAKDPDDRYQLSAEGSPAAEAPIVAGPTVVTPRSAMATPTVMTPTPPVESPIVDSAAPSDTDEYAEQPRRRGAARIVLVALACVVALVFVVVAVTRLLPTNDGRSTVAVPALIGQKLEAAEATLRQLGLEPKVKKVHGTSGDSVGTVTGQDPIAGRQVAAATVVTLEVNVGPTTVKIPKNLVGDQVEDARATLEAAGFTDVKTRAVRDQTGKAKAGEVLSVSPREGESAALDDSVELRYARTGSATSTSDPTTDASATTDPTKTTTADPTGAGTSAADPSTSRPKTTEPTQSAEPSQSAKPTPTTKKNKKVNPVKTKPVKTKPSKKAKPVT
jgi:beta-lactam-binding protein with PASTA domain